MAEGTQGPFAARLPARLRAGVGEVLEDDVEWLGLEVEGDYSAVVAASVDISECRIEDAAFTSTDLPRARIGDTIFADCELSGGAFHGAALTRVEFRECRMLGFSVSEGQLRDVRFVDCRLDGANLRVAAGERVAFERCSLVGADFCGSQLSQLRLFDCDLTEADFSEADMTGARLHGSTLVALHGARYLGGVVIDSEQLIPLAVEMFSATGVRIDDQR
jgi:uncharacterized protein YjbI with pentapeptide repeats